MNSRRFFILGILGVCFVGLGAEVWYLSQHSITGGEQANNILPASTSSVAGGDEKNAVKNSTASATASAEALLKAKMPSLSRGIPAGSDPATVSKIKETVQMLKDNYNYLQAWLELGNLREAVGDFDGAGEAWKFATVLRPKNSAAFLNLGDLYGWYLHDTAKAEPYLLAGIAAEPKTAYPYYKTYEFYTDIMKDKDKARKILEEGIAQNPDGAEGLKQTLNNL